MFVYEFMTGVCDTIKIATEGLEEFDPHLYRGVSNPTSYADTMMHLLKGSVGAGILAMPLAMRKVGIVMGVAGFTIVVCFATYCIHLLIRDQYILCKRMKRGYITYPHSMEFALETGPPCLKCVSYWIAGMVDSVLIFWQLGLCAIYSLFCAQNLKQVADYNGYVLHLRVWMVIILPPLVLISLIKDLKLLSPLSSISNFITLFGILIVFFYLIQDDVILSNRQLIYCETSIFVDGPYFIGLTLFAVEAVGVILALEHNMKNPKEFVGMFGLFNIGMIIITVLYIAVGVFGFLKYAYETEDSITLNLPITDKKAQAARIFFAVAIMMSFPLQNCVAYHILWPKLRQRMGEGRHFVPDYILRLLLIFLPWLLAVGIPHLGPFISLVGAVGLSLLALVFPALLDIGINYNEYGQHNIILVKDIAIMVLGLGCLFSGTYVSIMDMVSHHKND